MDAPPDPRAAGTGTPPPTSSRPPLRRRRRLRRLGLSLLVLLLCVGTAAGAALHWLNGDTGRRWLETTVNDALKKPLEAAGITLRIERLRGSLPCDLTLDVSLGDAEGVWLAVRDAALTWGRQGVALRIDRLHVADATLFRLPLLPPSPPEPEQTAADTLNTLRDTFGHIGEQLASLRFLPEIRLDSLDVRYRMPAALAALDAAAPGTRDAWLQTRLSGALNARFADTTVLEGALRLEASLAENAAPPVTSAQLALSLEAAAGGNLLRASIRELSGTLDGPFGDVRLDLAGSVETTPPAADWLRAPLDLTLRASYRPTLAASLAAIVAEHVRPAEAAQTFAPATLDLRLFGMADAPALRLQADVARLRALCLPDLPNLDDSRLLLESSALSWAALLRNEAAAADLRLTANARTGAAPLHLHLAAEAAQAAGGAERRLSLPLVSLSAPGATVQGHWRTLPALPPGAPAGTPSLLRDILDTLPPQEGELRAAVDDWPALGSVLNSLLDLSLPCSGDPAQLTLTAALSDPRQQQLQLALQAPRLHAGPSRLEGLRLDAQLLDDSVDSRLRLDGRLQHMQLPGFRLRQTTLALQGTPEALTITGAADGDLHARMALRWKPGELEIQRLAASLPQWHVGLTTSPGALLRYRLPGLHNTNDDAEPSLAFSRWRMDIQPSGHLVLDGALSARSLKAEARLQAPDLAAWRALVPALPEGALAFHAALAGTPQRPSGSFSLKADGIRMPDLPLPPLSAVLDGKLNASGLDARLALAPETLRALGGDEAHLTAHVPVTFSPDGLPLPAMNAPLKGSLRWNGQIGPLWQLVPLADRRLSGRLAAEINVRGSLAAPNPSGSIRLENGRFEDVALGVELRAISLQASLQHGNNRARSFLDRLGVFRLAADASDGRGGTLHIAGNLRPATLGIDADARINKLQPLRRRDVHVVFSGTLGVRGTLKAPAVQAAIEINEGLLLLNNLPSGGITTLPVTDKNAPPAQAVSSAPIQGTVNATLNTAPRTGFVVRGYGLESNWGIRLSAAGPLTAPLVTGNIFARSGKLQLLNKEFLLSQGRVSFSGGAVTNPQLALTLTRDAGDIEADVVISGSAQRPRLSLESRPALPQAEIISRVLFGRDSKDLGRWESLRLAAAVAELAGFGSSGSGVMDFARKASGMDVLRINSRNTTSADGEENEETTIEAGKFIGEKLYLGVEQGTRADSTAVLIELELTPRAKLQMRTESQNTSGNIRWKMNY